MLKDWSRSPEISVDDVAKRVGSFALIVYDINVSSLDSGEKESLAFLRPVFRRFNCPRLIYVKPDYVLCVFDDQASLKDCFETIGGGVRNKFRLRCPD